MKRLLLLRQERSSFRSPYLPISTRSASEQMKNDEKSSRREKIKCENRALGIVEIGTASTKRVLSTQKGSFKVTALVRNLRKCDKPVNSSLSGACSHSFASFFPSRVETSSHQDIKNKCLNFHKNMFMARRESFELAKAHPMRVCWDNRVKKPAPNTSLDNHRRLIILKRWFLLRVFFFMWIVLSAFGLDSWTERMESSKTWEAFLDRLKGILILYWLSALLERRTETFSLPTINRIAFRFQVHQPSIIHSLARTSTVHQPKHFTHWS